MARKEEFWGLGGNLLNVDRLQVLFLFRGYFFMRTPIIIYWIKTIDKFLKINKICV